MGVRCVNATDGRGCAIYDRRPHSCRVFECLWLSTPEMPDHWRPEQSKMVVAGEETGTVVSVICDGDHPDAWRAEPYYSEIKAWSRSMRWRIQILTGDEGWVIFPEEDLFAGKRAPDDQIVAFGYKEDRLGKRPAVTVGHGDGTETEVVGKLYPRR